MSSDPQLLAGLGGVLARLGRVLAQVLLQGWSRSCFPCALGGSSHLEDAGMGGSDWGSPVGSSFPKPAWQPLMPCVQSVMGRSHRGTPSSSLHVTPPFQADGRWVLRSSVLGTPSLWTDMGVLQALWVLPPNCCSNLFLSIFRDSVGKTRTSHLQTCWPEEPWPQEEGTDPSVAAPPSACQCLRQPLPQAFCCLLCPPSTCLSVAPCFPTWGLST